MPDAYPEIDERLPFTRGIPRVHIVGAAFEFERGRHTVMGLKLIVAGVLSVLMQVYEAGGHDQSRGVNGALSGQRSGGDGANLAVFDRDVANCIQAQLR